ncbi:MAG: response regulator [Methylobacter sp.]|uniref:response regulator n=1 Tax=Methylobacter sp. TaxID=2051955 RepID=UPI002582D6D6|nr:response regulator [Methylobacter sp.]MCL7422951.1 response regulator [Methylobacter sp.]
MAIRKILCVDDMAVELSNLKNILTEAGYEVTTAHSGKAAMDTIAANGNPDLIFMDIVMPDVDGFTTCRRLANDEATKNIPVIFLSSKGEQADKVWAQLQGGKAYITKPYQKNEILEQIKVFER